MKTQTKEEWVHDTLAMQKASLSIVSLNQQSIRKVPFSQIRTKISPSLLGKKLR